MMPKQLPTYSVHDAREAIGGVLRPLVGPSPGLEKHMKPLESQMKTTMVTGPSMLEMARAENAYAKMAPKSDPVHSVDTRIRSAGAFAIGLGIRTGTGELPRGTGFDW